MYPSPSVYLPLASMYLPPPSMYLMKGELGMRAKLRSVLRHPSWIGSWWFETPWRSPRNWRVLLFEPGAGWLRWAWVMGEIPPTYYEPGEPYWHAPPLRRLFEWLRDPQHDRGWWGMRLEGWPEDHLYPHVTRRERRRMVLRNVRVYGVDGSYDASDVQSELDPQSEIPEQNPRTESAP